MGWVWPRVGNVPEAGGLGLAGTDAGLASGGNDGLEAQCSAMGPSAWKSMTGLWPLVAASHALSVPIGRLGMGWGWLPGRGPKGCSILAYSPAKGTGKEKGSQSGAYPAP